MGLCGILTGGGGDQKSNVSRLNTQKGSIQGDSNDIGTISYVYKPVTLYCKKSVMADGSPIYARGTVH